MPSAIERFERAAAAAGLSLEITRFPQGTRTAADAARAVGCEIGQIVKSLVFMADDRPLLALTSGSNRADPRRLGDLMGGGQKSAAPTRRKPGRPPDTPSGERRPSGTLAPYPCWSIVISCPTT
jgi:Aminoacyl-tRNA editing domain